MSSVSDLGTQTRTSDGNLSLSRLLILYRYRYDFAEDFIHGHDNA